MDGITMNELREQLEYASAVRGRQRNTLGARIQVSLIWAAISVATGAVISPGGWYLLLLPPLYLAGAFATMVTALWLRRKRGELTEVSERRAALHWGVSVLFMLLVAVFQRLTGQVSQPLLPLMAGFAHILAGAHLERSYLFTAVFMLAGAMVLLVEPAVLPYPGFSVTALGLAAGSLAARIRYHGN